MNQQQVIDEKLEQIRILKEEVTGLQSKVLNDEAAKIFKDCPRLMAVTWTQYTPYFNDGSPCEFDVNTPHFAVDVSVDQTAKLTPEMIENAQNEEDSGSQDVLILNDWSMGNFGPDRDENKDFWRDYYKETYERVTGNIGVQELESIISMLTEFGKKIEHDDLEETLYDRFGDHVQVLLTRSGFEVEEYDHD